MKEYRRTDLKTGITVVLRFDATHYAEVGMTWGLDGGMPEKIAVALMNKWNAQQATCRPPNPIQWMYWVV